LNISREGDSTASLGNLFQCSITVIDGLAGLVKCKTKDKLALRHLSTEGSRAEELTKGVINWCLSHQPKVRGDSPSL